MKKLLYIPLFILVIFTVYYFLPPQKKLMLFVKIEKPWFRMRVSKPISFINAKRLEAKIARGLPVWAKNQIAEDLSHFKKIQLSDLKTYYDKNNNQHNRLVFCKIRNKTLEMSITDPSLEKLISYGIMKIVLQYIAKNHDIPDTDFILSLQDFVEVSDQTKDSVPIFTFAKDTKKLLEKDLILIPDWMNLRSGAELSPRISFANTLYPWNKKQAVLFWRGGFADSTGFRRKLVDLAKIEPLRINAQFSQNNPKEYLPEEQHVQYRYQITIDGSRGTWERLVWQLQTNCLVFKHQSNHVQWFYQGIQPNLHYISVTDEPSVLKAIDWADANPKEAIEITERAQAFAKDNLTLEDMLHYMIVLLKEYSKKIT